MKLIILLSLLAGQSFAALNMNSQCPKGQTLERFTPKLTDGTGTEINQDIYMCVISVEECETVSKISIHKSKYTKSTIRIKEGFKCSWSNRNQCQQQSQIPQQTWSSHHQQPQGPQIQVQKGQTVQMQRQYRVQSLKHTFDKRVIADVMSGDYVRFDNKLYRCEL